MRFMRTQYSLINSPVEQNVCSLLQMCRPKELGVQTLVTAERTKTCKVDVATQISNGITREIRTIYFHGINNVFVSKFQQITNEEKSCLQRTTYLECDN